MDDYVLARAQAVREAPAHKGMYVAPSGIGTHTADPLASLLREAIASQSEAMAAMRADKPTVTDSHSDGKRVRYVRHEERQRTLESILAILEGGTR